MAGKTRPMSQIKQLLQLHKQGMKYNTIARTLGISRNTVKSYLHKLSLQKINIDTLLKLDDPILEVRFHAGNPAYLDGRFEYFQSRLAYYESELKRKHVTRRICGRSIAQSNRKVMVIRSSAIIYHNISLPANQPWY